MNSNIITKMFFLTLIAFANFLLLGGENPKPQWLSKNVFHDDVFVKNEGQFPDMFNQQILYKDLRDHIYITNKGFIIETKKIIKEREGLFSKEQEIKIKSFFSEIEFIGINENFETLHFDEQKEGYYTFQNSQKMFKGYKKIELKNIYKNIDLIVKINEENGIKYLFVVHPGGNINDIQIKIHSKKKYRLDELGNIHIPTEAGEIIDKKPITYQEGKEIKSSYQIENDIIRFDIDRFDINQELLIDPFVIVPTSLPGNQAYDIDYDQYGNVYVSAPTMQVSKYNASGGFLWTYNGVGGSYFSEFATLPSGSVIWGEGFNSGGARIYKISPNGLLQITGGPYSTREVWTIFYNRCSNQILGFGGGTSNMNNLQIVNDTNLTGGTIKNYNGYTGSCCNDVVDAIIDANGDFFAVQVTGTGPEKLQKCAGPLYNPPLLFDVGLGYGYEECNCFSAPGIPLSTNRANVLALNSSYLFTYGGKTIKVWNKTTGALISSFVVNGGYIDGVGRTCDGIAVDECNNVYVGGLNTIHAYNFNGSSFTPLPNIATPGAVYDVMLDEANGLLYACGNGFVGVYSVPVNMSFSLSSIPASCGNCNGSINVANTSTCTSTGFRYIINPGNITSTVSPINNLCPQLYTVEVHLGCRGKIWEDTITVSSTTYIPVNISVSNPPCNGGVGSATVLPYNSNYNYTWTPALGSGTLGTNLPAGNYTVYVSSNIGSCNGSGTFQIIQPPALSLTASQTQSVSCNGGNNGAANAFASGGVGGYTYTWTPSGGNNNSATNLMAGIYTISVSDANNCGPISTTVQIIEPPALSLTATQTQSILCNGGNNGSANAIASGGVGGYTYTWTPFGGNNQTASNLTAGIYTITISDANFCGPISTTVQILEPPALSLTATQSQSVSCNGGNNGAANATPNGGVGGYTYTWSPTGGNNSSASGLTAGIYTLNVQDANGCSISDTVQILQPPALSLTATQTQSVSCYGGNDGTANSLASGGVGGYTYTWAPAGGNNSNASGLSANIYTIFVNDANNCSISTTVQIIQPPALSLTASQTQSVSCNGGNNGAANAFASGGVGGYTYTWTPSGGNNNSATNLTAGIYTISISDGNNCGPISTTVQIIEPPALSLTATQTQSILCNGGNNGSANAIVSGGVGGYTYTWTPSGGNNQTATNLTAGIYTITISDANLCGPISTTVQIDEPPALSITVTGQSVTCYGYANGSATANVTGGVGGYSYTWTPGNANSQIVNGLLANTYTVNVLDANNCFISASINIPQPSSVSLVTSPNQTICYGNSTNILANAGGGTPPYSYNWNNGLPNSGGPHLVTLTSTTIYTVQAVDAQNCTSPIGSIKITVLPPLLAAGMSTTICDGLSAEIYPTITSPGNGGPYTYLWSNMQTNPTITIVGNYALGTTNIYTVSISDGCSNPDAITQITVNVNPNPVISFSANPVKGCVPLTVSYFATSDGNNDTFHWYFDNEDESTNPNAITTYTLSGFYTPTLVVTNSFGCVTTSVAPNYIEVYPLPIADFEADPWGTTIVTPTINFVNTSNGAVSYLWNFGDYASPNNTTTVVNPSHEYTYSGTYTVTLIATNQYGCADYIAKVITIDPEFHLYIPNVFTPDGNGLNDVFQPKGIGIDENDYKMLIFDRWGELIFESNNFQKGWDGSVKGSSGKATQDVYVYKIYVRDLKGNKHEFVGHVTCLPYMGEK
ncbi:MAG: hypothetical protein KatS3mg027_1164 [Bacteroidia bacterium]|nr:MAG: hypothetical protein KatS3mg027_1164 [Bacteroidia bacterium]